MTVGYAVETAFGSPGATRRGLYRTDCLPALSSGADSARFAGILHTYGTRDWFAQSIVRSDENLLCVAIQLKCVQQLGYFPNLDQVPPAVGNHIRLCLGVPPSVPLQYDQSRTTYRHHDAIRDYLRLIPHHDRRARRIAVRAVFEAAKVMDNPADLINVAVEQLRANNCELMGFPSLDRLVQRRVQGDTRAGLIKAHTATRATGIPAFSGASSLPGLEKLFRNSKLRFFGACKQ